MPLFFLHVRDGMDVTSDLEGSCLPDLGAARTLAIASARQMMGEAVTHGARIGLNRIFEIADEGGATLLAVPFKDAVNFDAAA